MTTIEIPDDQAAALTEKAAAEGLSLEEWIQRLAFEGRNQRGGVQTAADIVLEEMSRVPDSMMATLPEDGASQHDHYLYGWPKNNSDSCLCRHFLLGCIS